MLDMKPIAKITRSKLYPRLGNYKFEWKWLYTVDYGVVMPHVGQATASFDTLASAKAACVRNGFKPLETWKQQ